MENIEAFSVELVGGAVELSFYDLFDETVGTYVLPPQDALKLMLGIARLAGIV